MSAIEIFVVAFVPVTALVVGFLADRFENRNR